MTKHLHLAQCQHVVLSRLNAHGASNQIADKCSHREGRCGFIQDALLTVDLHHEVVESTGAAVLPVVDGDLGDSGESVSLGLPPGASGGGGVSAGVLKEVLVGVAIDGSLARSAPGRRVLRAA